ncbi:MAG: DUF3047 domain-containing protein [Burkholderiales bacterium]|nr:DUF3047 domain-containing protein [Burkholderiales bacterium]
MKISPFFLTALLSTIGSCASAAETRPACQTLQLAFAQHPDEWAHLPLSKFKNDTQYKIVREAGQQVLRAEADDSASLYALKLKTPSAAFNTLQWRWKTDVLIPGADNRDQKREDSPLRVMLSFDGDLASLPESEQFRIKMSKVIAGVELPFATLMYIWSEQYPLESIIASAHTSQLKMLVVASGKHGLGAWQNMQRDIAEDYRRAFGSAPGRLIGVSVMTDTDNTGKKAVGWYADLSLSCANK